MENQSQEFKTNLWNDAIAESKLGTSRNKWRGWALKQYSLCGKYLETPFSGYWENLIDVITLVEFTN